MWLYCCDQCGVEEEEYIQQEDSCPALKKISSGLKGNIGPQGIGTLVNQVAHGVMVLLLLT